MQVVSFLDKMRVPFFVLISLIWAMEIVNAFLRAFGTGPILILLAVVSIFYLTVSLLTAIFFIHYGRRLLSTLDDPNIRKADSKSNKFKVSPYILPTSIVFILNVFLGNSDVGCKFSFGTRVRSLFNMARYSSLLPAMGIFRL